MIHEVSEGE